VLGAEGDNKGSQKEQIKYEGNRTLSQIVIPLLQLTIKTLVLKRIRRDIDPYLPPQFIADGKEGIMDTRLDYLSSQSFSTTADTPKRGLAKPPTLVHTTLTYSVL
jgi:hypothetical protein